MITAQMNALSRSIPEKVGGCYRTDGVCQFSEVSTSTRKDIIIVVLL